MKFTESTVFSGPVYLVCKYTFWIIPCSLLKVFNRFHQYSAFIVGFIRYLFNSSQSGFIKAQVKLCAKLNGCFCFSSDNWTKPWLGYAYNTILYAVYFVLIHVLLLLVKFIYGQQ